MAYTIDDRALALAGILQPLEQVQSIAKQGQFDEAVLETSVQSILNKNPTRVGAVFGGAAAMQRGLRLLIQQFEKRTDLTDKMLLHYFVGVNQLQKKLIKDTLRLEKISEGIDDVERKRQHFPLLHESIIARLADIYSTTVSDLQPRIIVQGEHVYLANTAHINRVRTLLLAAIRSAHLWRQCGGGHIKLLFERSKLVAAAQNLLKAST